MQISPYLTVKEAAELLRVEPRTLSYWTKAGRIQPFRVNGNGIRYRREDVLALISTDPRPRAALFGRANA